MLLRKATGGCTLLGYTWEHDGDTVEVPGEVAAELLAIRGADFSAVAPEEKPDPKREITEPEPEPAAEAAVTEPAPKVAAPVSEGPAKPPAAK